MAAESQEQLWSCAVSEAQLAKNVAGTAKGWTYHGMMKHAPYLKVAPQQSDDMGTKVPNPMVEYKAASSDNMIYKKSLAHGAIRNCQY